MDYRPKRGDVYWIEPSVYRPAVGTMMKGRRPAIIVSSEKQCESRTMTYQVVYLTTQPKRDMPTHCTINSGGVRSTALCEQITTVSHEQLAQYKCTVSEQEMQYIDICLAISLGIDTPSASEPASENINIVMDTVEASELRAKLAAMEAERDVYKSLYEDFLGKMLNKA